MATKIQNQSTKNDPVLADVPKACSDETAAVEFLEKQRWGNSPACPHCGVFNVYQMRDSKTGERQANYRWRCNDCKSQFTVRIGTVFEESRIPLRHWCYAFWRASTSKKGVSALEIKRQTGLSYKSALFLLNRIRFAMEEPTTPPLSGDVEIDETFVGGKVRYHGTKHHHASNDKVPVLAMVERGGRVRARPVANIRGSTLKSVIVQTVDPSARIYTDERLAYRSIGKHFASHDAVNHSAGEYARGHVTSNTVESFFAILKRGINGIYHAVSKEHLHRYTSEFQFRYDYHHLSDGERTKAAIRAADGKRLAYKDCVVRV
jgi:transposase-like protein